MQIYYNLTEGKIFHKSDLEKGNIRSYIAD